MDVESIKNLQDWYNKNDKNFEKLGKSLTENIRALLNEADIQFFNIKYRIKDYESSKAKMYRKGYSDYSLIEDICGIRILCFYEDDIIKVSSILTKHLTCRIEDKSEKGDTFWYRGTHLVGTIPKKWENTPVFHGLTDYKFEIQIRTITSHAWSEIEHSLSYKGEITPNEEITRQFAGLSSQLEQIDKTFIKIRNDLNLYKERIKKNILKNEIAKLKGVVVDEYILSLLITQIFGKEEYIKDNKMLEIFTLCKSSNIDAAIMFKFLDVNKELLKELLQEYQSITFGSEYVRAIGIIVGKKTTGGLKKVTFVYISNLLFDVLKILLEGTYKLKDKNGVIPRNFIAKVKKMKLPD